MILVDTSVWIDHFRRGNAELGSLLDAGVVACHPFVIGELACGALRRRDEILALLERLPVLHVAEHEEALAFVAARKLGGTGLGWVDVHLLASAVIDGCQVLTHDRALAAAAAALGVSGTRR